MISYERELDIDNKLNNYLKITDILNNLFRPQKSLQKTTIKLNNTLALPVLLHGSVTWTVKARDARRITAGDEIHEKNSRIHSDRSQNKHTNCKTDKNNPNFGQITGIQDKVDKTCK
jgi:hypothetical protein